MFGRDHSMMAGRVSSLAAMILLLGAAACADDGADDTGTEGGFAPVTDAMLQSPAPEDWLMWRRTLDGWGYSPLASINRDNVADLETAWTRPLGQGIQQGTPLVYDGVMYMPNPMDHIQALDAASGDLRWEHRREMPPDLFMYMRPDLSGHNRNLAIFGRTLIDTSTDDHVYAVDAVTGEQVWETRILDYTVNPAHQNSGPIIADGKVVSGRGCMPEGGPDACVVTAHDATTGEELWRRRMIPAPGEPGDESWGGVPFEERRHVGAWMVPSYDPDLGLVYVGTSVTSPAPKFMLGGIDNKHLYHNSTLALDVNTGEIAWYYQHLNDHWDFDHPFERLLVETAIAPDASVRWVNPRIASGEVRRVVTGIPGKSGIVYTLDRATGEFLWATPTVSQNVVADIDGATGEVFVNDDVVFTSVGDEVTTCPTWYGGKAWEAGAYSPEANAMYMPLQNACARMAVQTEGGDDLGAAVYALSSVPRLAPGTENLGTVRAISAETGATLWTYEQRAQTTSLVATGGGLVFGGDAGGRFFALDQTTGEVLWQTELGAPVTGFPVTYAVDGRQYVAVSTGIGGTTVNHIVLTPEIPLNPQNNLYVFALPN